ncbi:efflux RND transporter periplasmic adaptor subunit [Falsiphaeobacter marinintestinus]|uniref:efflux RND transporter periplasmic adaptor subunit n=1 Tax=Falsiphaeobacter marinintestinus TaxID=1492905 RepID=UPI0011B42254|nr:efflux RND transporter periplasmic adaptor subunit [Phaeobacter marinintestinus]
MRLVPFITALLVTAGLYLAVFERDTVLAYARGAGAAETAPQEDAVEQDDAPDVVEAASNAVGVVAIRSVATPIDSAVILRGDTQASRRVQVRSETSAIVNSEPLRKGRYIEKGEVLCQLDPGTREASLAEAHAMLAEARSHVPESDANLETARARLEEAQINWNAAEKLAAGGYTSETSKAGAAAAVRAAEAGVESAKAGLESAQAGIESAQAKFAAAQREIERLTIMAPFEGLLESDTAEIGSLLQAGGLCAEILQLDPIKVVGYVPETEVNRVQVGAIAGAELATGLRVQGRVTFLSRSADPTTRTFLVEVTVENTDLAIRDGQTATIAIGAEGIKAHKVPQSALTLNNDGQLGIRAVASGNLVKFHPVRLLRDDIDGVWIGGLPETADVIVVGQDFVIDGVHVTPTYREAAQ